GRMSSAAPQYPELVSTLRRFRVVPKPDLNSQRLALFRLTRREKVVEPPKDRSADDAIHQRIDRPGNDRAHPGARTVTSEDGPAHLKKRLPVARADHGGRRNDECGGVP